MTHGKTMKDSARQHQRKAEVRSSPSFRHPFAGGPYAEVLGLQRAVGNQAVSSLLLRGPRQIVQSVLHDGRGQPLDPATRALMKSRFQHDFSQVRVHTDPLAAESAEALNACAYTVGRDVVFASGQYAPHTQSGRQLLAHELAHTIQQRNACGSLPQTFTSNSPDQQLEKHADAVSQLVNAVPSGGLHRERTRSSPLIQTGPSIEPCIQRKVRFEKSSAATAREVFDAYYFGAPTFKFHSGENTALVTTPVSAHPAGLAQEILWALAHSKNEYRATSQTLQKEIEVRASIVTSGLVLGGGNPSGAHARFAGFGATIGEDKPNIKLNPKFWAMDTPIHEVEEQYDVVMRSIPAVKPSAAIKDVFDHPELYEFECYTSTLFIQLHALLKRQGSELFDTQFSPNIRLPFTAKHGSRAIDVSMEKYLGRQEVDIGSENNYDELIPGDQVAFTAEGFNENGIYLFGGRFYAHPIIANSIKEVESYWKKTGLRLGRFRYRWPGVSIPAK